MRDYFEKLSAAVFGSLEAGEKASLFFQGEASDFVRFNQGQVRQIGSVEQAYASFTLQRNGREIGERFICSEDAQQDAERVRSRLPDLRADLACLPEDPHLEFYEGSERRIEEGAAPETKIHDVVEDVCGAAAGCDLVGFLICGPQFFGYANHLGAFKWYRRASTVFEYSLYAGGDKAVKTSIAGGDWDRDKWLRSLQTQQQQLALMTRPPAKIEPGAYRVYLSPAAVGEILSLFCWGGFSQRAKNEKRASLQLLYEGKKTLDPRVRVSEDVASGVGPFFNETGFDRPERVALIQAGRGESLLVAPRTARQSNLPTNGADDDEIPLSLSMDGGKLSESSVLPTLDRGLYINNLWYLNYSDRLAGRFTGMTRFGCFEVQNGELVAPIPVMRFDDTIYDLLGAALEELTQGCEKQISASTYRSRSVSSMCLPGALIGKMKFTL